MNNSEVHIPTIGGAINVVSVPNLVSRESTRYIAILDQVGVGNAPTVRNVIENSAQLFPTFNWTANGQFSLVSPNSFGNFPINNKTVISIGNTIGNQFKVSARLVDFSTILIETGLIDVNGITPVNSALTITPITIEQFTTEVPINNEQQFLYILSTLDAIQVTIWRKIVVRFMGGIISVDGDTYRRTLDFAQSSKIINS